MVPMQGKNGVGLSVAATVKWRQILLLSKSAAASPRQLEVHGPIARSHDWASKTIKLFLHRPDVATGDNHVVEPDGLAVFPVLLGRVVLVVAVVFEPEAIHLQIHVVAPTDADEFTDQPPIDPH